MARTFSDLGINPDRLPDRRPPSGLLLIEGIEPWDRGRQEAARKLGMCEIHGAGRPGGPGKRYCLACDRCSLDGKPGVAYPGLPVGSAMDPEWTEPTRYEPPPPGLKGGLGGRVAKKRKRWRGVGAA